MAGEGQKYKLRSFRDGDEVVLAELFNRVYDSFTGFVPRTPRFWVWCCLERPDVDKGSIVVVERGEEVVGYAVVGSSGNVWELCYDPDYDGKKVVSMLLEWAVDFVDGAGGDCVKFNGLVQDDVLRKVCGELGFVETKPDPLFVSVLDLPNLLGQLLESNREELDLEEGIFVFRLRNSPSWCGDQVSVRVRGGEVWTGEGVIDEPEFVVDVDWSTLVSCILGTKRVWRAVLNSEVKVSPFWKFRKFLRVFSSLQVGRPWFWPRADFG